MERHWNEEVYDELNYKEDLFEDNKQNSMRKKFEYALGKLGIEIVESTGGTYHGSEYVYAKLPNGDIKKIRFADHKQVHSADMSVEDNWRDAFKFFVERLKKEDWTEENFSENIRFAKPAAAKSDVRDGDNFRAELDEFKSGRLPTYKILKLGMPSE